MRILNLRTAFVILCVSAAGCGKAQMRSSSLSDSHSLSATDISQAGLSTAYDVVERLRPQWLHVRAARSLNGGGPEVSGPGAVSVVVYVDGVRAGDLSALRDIPASSVDNMKFLDASEATNEHGTGHLYGAIEVRTRHGTSGH